MINNIPGFKLTTLHAYVVTEPDGTEGIAAVLAENGVWYPMVRADQTRIDELRPRAEAIQRATGLPVTLVKFHLRQNVEEIHG